MEGNASQKLYKTVKNSQNPWDKVALNYEDEVISPIHHSENAALQKVLNKIRLKNQLHIGDLGCGTGPLLCQLSKKFKKVSAVDFSHSMIVLAKERCQAFKQELQKKISFKKSSLTNLGFLKNKLDVALSINSLIMTDAKELKKATGQIFSTLKREGVFIAVLPALESIQEEYQHTFAQEMKRYKSEELAMAATNKKLETQRIDFKLGRYDTEDMIQKYFTQYEIQKLFSEAGFKNIKFDRVIYNEQQSYNYSGETKGHPPMWDWLVSAKKS